LASELVKYTVGLILGQLLS